MYDFPYEFGNPAHLAAAIQMEDDMEDRGLHADDRLTCHTCREWATDAHLTGDKHTRLL